MKDDSITLLNTYLKEYTELSDCAAFAKRSKSKKPSNALKLRKATPFIKLVCEEIRNHPLSSIDKTIHDLILNKPSAIVDMTTVSTKTFYHYVHAGFIDIKPIDLPRTVQRKKNSL